VLCLRKSPKIHLFICTSQLRPTQRAFTMPGGFIRKEPTDSKKLRETPAVVELFSRARWMSFCDKLQGCDDEVAEESLRDLQPKSKTLSVVNFRGLTIRLTPCYSSKSHSSGLWCCTHGLGQPLLLDLVLKFKKQCFIPYTRLCPELNACIRGYVYTQPAYMY